MNDPRAVLVALDNAVEAVAARVTPAVVNVAVTSRMSDQDAESYDDGGNDQGSGGGHGIPQNQIPPEFRRFFFGGGGGPQQPQIEHGIGSGIIISPDGYVLTNNHVVNGATQIRVTLNDRRVFPAKLVGVDKLNDLAVVKINANNLTTVAWGDSTKLRPGQTVLAFGSPFGYFQFSVTRGIVSAVDRPNPYSDDPRKPGDYIQTDAAINPGNSGGPLVDLNGQVIGINTLVAGQAEPGVQAQGIGFAISIATAKPIADQLVSSGQVVHPYIGIQYVPLNPAIATQLQIPTSTQGVVIGGVQPGSPAAQAGLQQRDVVTAVDGQQLAGDTALAEAVNAHKPGDTVTLSVTRGGQQTSVQVTLGTLPSSQ